MILEKYFGIDKENMANQINLRYTRDLDEALESEEYAEYIDGRIEEMGDEIYEICTDSDLSDKEKYENIVEVLNDTLRP